MEKHWVQVGYVTVRGIEYDVFKCTRHPHAEYWTENDGGCSECLDEYYDEWDEEVL